MEIKKKTLVLSAILMLVLLCDAAMAIPMPPHQFAGNVTIDGKPAPDGTVVSARIGGVEYVREETVNGKYGFREPFRVPTDDPDTAEKEGGVNGEVVEFYVNNELAANATFSFGGMTNLNLKIGEEPVPEPEEPVVTQGFLVPVILAIVIVLLAVVVFIIRRRKR